MCVHVCVCACVCVSVCIRILFIESAGSVLPNSCVCVLCVCACMCVRACVCVCVYTHTIHREYQLATTHCPMPALHALTRRGEGVLDSIALNEVAQYIIMLYTH